MDADKSLEMIKAVYEDGEAEIHGRKYKLLKMRHQKRLQVFAFFSGVQGELSKGSFSFMGQPGWEEIEKKICQHVTFNGDLLDKVPDHFEKFPEDYILFATTMLGAMSYPFLAGSLTA
jgi:hypothetical protein